MLRTNTKVTLETILFIAVLVACAPLVSAPTSKQDPSSGTDLASVMAVSDLSAGKNRLAFGLFDANGVEVITDSLEADLYFLGGEQPEHTNSYLAKYRKIETEIPHQHSDGEVHMHQDSRGVYVINDASLDTAGKWGLALRVHQKNKASAQTTTLTFQVNEESLTPAVGMPAPASQSPIAKTDTELTAICSRVPPDNMHHMTVGEALKSGLPTVVIFASPSFCQTRLCGPVTDQVLDLKKSYHSQVNFIHIEPFDLDIARNEGRLQLTNVATQWGLPTEPWVFVVDNDGTISAKLEGIFGSEELEQVIQEVIDES